MIPVTVFRREEDGDMGIMGFLFSVYRGILLGLRGYVVLCFGFTEGGAGSHFPFLIFWKVAFWSLNFQLGEPLAAICMLCVSVRRVRGYGRTISLHRVN